ncbi:hypothetical protein LEN26_012339 [Aphanomyces euteiches]|nr:hypothetical protein LEN26_012339 [Aphanomyces euteiches]KAH9129101.1 hypothetical protein AeMF1_000812 [Aphanomyces euteiches]KAH9183467.1 hypothetical protein AeNC1_014556 [Aphanomyces euteiches]
MAILRHQELDAVIWGGGSDKAPSDPVLDQHFRTLKFVWAVRVVTWFAKSWKEHAWAEDATKATGVLLLLYALSFFLHARRRHTLNIRLLLLLAVVGFVADVARPVVPLISQGHLLSELLPFSGISFILAAAMLWTNAQILRALVRHMQTMHKSKKRL